MYTTGPHLIDLRAEKPSEQPALCSVQGKNVTGPRPCIIRGTILSPAERTAGLPITDHMFDGELRGMSVVSGLNPRPTLAIVRKAAIKPYSDSVLLPV
jgi:hypothetical protein